MEPTHSDLDHIDLDAWISEARRSVAELNARVVTFVKEHPAACLLGAVTMGFLAGRIAARA